MSSFANDALESSDIISVPSVVSIMHILAANRIRKIEMSQSDVPLVDCILELKL